MRPPRFGLLRRGGYQPPAGVWYAPLHMQLCKEHAVRLSRLGLFRRGGYQPPVGAWYAPLHILPLQRHIIHPLMSWPPS